MHILITGAFDFVGTNLSKAIKTLTDHQLIAVDISEQENHTYNEYYSWNELEHIPPVDAVIHQAGKAHDTKNQSKEQFIFPFGMGSTKLLHS